MANRVLKLSLFLLMCSRCLVNDRSGEISAHINEILSAQYPTPVAIAPSGELIVVKSRMSSTFVLEVRSTKHGEIIARTESRENQLEITWSPDSSKIAFLASAGGKTVFKLHVWNVILGTISQLAAPVTRTAFPPVRWSPNSALIAYLVAEHDEGVVWIADPAGIKASTPMLAGVRVLSDFQWSPSGNCLAFVSANSPGALRVLNTKTGLIETKIQVVRDKGEIRSLSWHPSGTALLVSAREQGHFFELVRVTLSSGEVLVRASLQGDILSPQFDPTGHVVVLKVVTNADEQLVIIHTDHSGVLRSRQMFHGRVDIGPILFKHRTVAVLNTGHTDPAMLYEVSLERGTPTLLYSSPHARQLRASSPSITSISTVDAKPTSVIMWEPDSGTQAGVNAVVYVHGGPHLNEHSAWNSTAAVLLQHNMSLFSVNYHGSTGYGDEYEQSGTLAQRIEEVVAVCHYVRKRQGRSGRLILLGESYGAYVAAIAARHNWNLLDGLVLLSVPGGSESSAPNPTRLPIPVIAFNGLNDITSRRAAYVTLETLLGKKVFMRSGSRWFMFPNEGHSFSTTSSWVEVLSSLVMLANK